MPEISVIMAAYHEKPDIFAAAVQSILSQSWKDLECIVVLDDPDHKELEELMCQIAAKDSRFRFYVNEKNSGAAAARNRAIWAAKGKYIAHMDSDDISAADRLKKQYEFMKREKLDFSASGSKVIDENGAWLYDAVSIPAGDHNIKKALKYGQVLAHSSWMVKSELYKQLKGYRNIPLVEDYDFTLRAALHGARFGVLKEPLISYRMTRSSVSRTNLYLQYLYMKYLSQQYCKGQSADICELLKYGEVHNSKARANRYSKTNASFNNMLEAMNNRRFLAFFYYGICTTFGSLAYLDKIRRLAVQSFLS